MRSVEKPTIIQRSISPVVSQHMHDKQYAGRTDFRVNNKVNLITSKLWEAITGEKLTVEALCSVLGTSIPTNETQTVNLIQSQQQQYVLLSKDSTQSRALQTKIEESSPAEQAMIFDALAPSLQELVFDQFANFVIQKLCEVATKEQQDVLLKFFLSDINRIVEHSIACRVLQRFMETTSKENVDQLFTALKPNLMGLCLSQNGNHIVQRFVITLPDKLQEIIDCILPNVISLAVDNCGCRIVQRLFEQHKITKLAPIVEEVLKNAVDLATNQYGNYVIQYILQSECKEYISALLRAFKGKFYKFSIHKFASNVIEKCITYGSEEERQDIFSEIIGTPGNFDTARILSMVKDQFGNYVIQRIIEYGTHPQRDAVYEVVYENYELLSTVQYSRHVLTRLHNLHYTF